MQSNAAPSLFWSLLSYGDWRVHIAATSEGLCFVGSHDLPLTELADWAFKKMPGSQLVQDDEKLQPYAAELIEYLQGERQQFTVPLALRGTPFQQTVWNALIRIPYGQTLSYSDIAGQIGRPDAARAVSAAIGANPILITVPCIAPSGRTALSPVIAEACR
jgi:methylated-DNA-[protein]-cysteine S-methyltransferase